MEVLFIEKFKNFINFRFSCNDKEDVNTSSLLLGTFSNFSTPRSPVPSGSLFVVRCRIAIYSRALNSRYVLSRVFARHFTREEEE